MRTKFPANGTSFPIPLPVASAKMEEVVIGASKYRCRHRHSVLGGNRNPSLRLLATVLRDAKFQGTVYMLQQLVPARKGG